MGLNKPSELPRWSDNGGTIIEPSEAKKNIGFIAERPPFPFLNWLFNLIYQWLEYFNNSVTGTEDGVISGAAKASGYPQFLSVTGTDQRFSILGATTPLVMQIDGQRYQLNTNLTLGSDLPLAPSSDNTGTVGEGDGSSQTCYFGEYGGRINLSGAPGSGITALENVLQAYNLANGANSEICLARFLTSQIWDPAYKIVPIIRGVCGTDRQPLTSASTTLTLLQAHWIFLNKDMATIVVTENEPHYQATAPSGPSTNDFWFNTTLKSWARWNGSAWVYEGYGYLGYAVTDSAHCIGVEHADFQGINWDGTLSYKKLTSDEYNEYNYRIHGPGRVSVAGVMVSLDEEIIKGASGPDEAGNGGWPWFFVYLKPDGTLINSPKGPRKRDFRKGWYHPSQYWRCIGIYAKNVWSETWGDYDPESGLCGMTYRDDVGSGRPGVFAFNFLTGETDDAGYTAVHYPNVPPIMRDFNIIFKAYATSGTGLPNEVYLCESRDTLGYPTNFLVQQVGALNAWFVSAPDVVMEACRPVLRYYGNGATDPLGYTTLEAVFSSGRIKF